VTRGYGDSPILLSLWPYVKAFHLFEFLARRRVLKIVPLPESAREHQIRPVRKVAPVPNATSKTFYKSYIYEENSTLILSETSISINFGEKLQEIYNRAALVQHKSSLSELEGESLVSSA
jgi:hypothetical protein